MKKFFATKKAKFLLSVLALLLGLMIADIYSRGTASIISSAVGFVVTPFQRASANLSNKTSELLQKNTDANALYEENQKLKAEVRKLREQMLDYSNLKYENEQYRRLTNTIGSERNWTMKPAAVVARDPLNRFYSFSIDKGSLDGIKYLDPVISSDGLVGYIAEVGASFSKVMTILDVNTDVGVYSGSVHDIGVLTGDIVLSSDGLAVVKYLPRNSAVTVGDMIVTSGSFSGNSSLYPRDIIIGTVVSIAPDDYGTNLDAVVKPYTDIKNVRDVFVITNFEEKAGE